MIPVMDFFMKLMGTPFHIWSSVLLVIIAFIVITALAMDDAGKIDSDAGNAYIGAVFFFISWPIMVWVAIWVVIGVVLMGCGYALLRFGIYHPAKISRTLFMGAGKRGISQENKTTLLRPMGANDES